MNLVVNAREAIQGRGSIIVRAGRKEVEVAEPGGLDAGSYVVIEVEDDGSGMDSIVAERAFEPYFTTRTTGGGSGMGLSMVAGFCRRHGGLATICSELGHGTTVAMILPRDAFGDAASEASDRDSLAVLRPVSVLVVDDDAVINEFATVVLEEKGCSVKSAASLDAALTMLKESRFDVVVTDVQLKGPRDGCVLVERIRSTNPSTHFVLTSGLPLGRAEIPDSVEFILKPYRVDELVRAVSRAAESPRK